MKMIETFADILNNPQNIVAYKKLVDCYHSNDMINEKEAFAKLLEKKFNVNRSGSDQKQ